MNVFREPSTRCRDGLERIESVLVTSHLGNPFVHLQELFLKSLLESLAGGPHGVSLLPVREAVLKDLTDISQEFFLVRVLLSVHLGLDGGQVHRPLDLVKVIRHAILDGLHGITKGADQSGPETCAG